MQEEEREWLSNMLEEVAGDFVSLAVTACQCLSRYSLLRMTVVVVPPPPLLLLVVVVLLLLVVMVVVMVVVVVVVAGHGRASKGGYQGFDLS